MRIMNSCYNRILLISILILGLVLAPGIPTLASADEKAGTTSSTKTKKPKSQSAGSTGVGVSGTPLKPAPTGKGALAPPVQQAEPTAQPQPVKNAEKKTVPKGIGASAGTAGASGTGSSRGLSLGWKVGAGVLGLGIILGAAGGGGGGGGGGGSSSNH